MSKVKKTLTHANSEVRVPPQIKSFPSYPAKEEMVQGRTSLEQLFGTQETPSFFLDQSRKERYLEVIKQVPAQGCACFWDTEPIDTVPIVCPLSYHNGMFESDGQFCSFPCCYAYILENIKSNRVLYKDSVTLLALLHHKLFLNQKLELFTAPSWRALKKFGGTLTISEFRKSFETLRYLPTENIKFSSIERIHEKVQKF